jgi:hypothetical protein
MRLWSLHPRYLDARGLVALWREALLAQAVLRGDTRGYRHHPQVIRFRAQPWPARAIAAYLRVVHEESLARCYQFDRRKVGRAAPAGALTVTRGQLQHEWQHLMAKLAARDPERRARLRTVKRPRPHPLFRVVAGDIEVWERVMAFPDARRRGPPVER